MHDGIIMRQIISITSRGQVNIPKLMLQELGVKGSTKAIIQRRGNAIFVTPQSDFWSLAGSLKPEIKLSDDQIKKARNSFSKSWVEQIKANN